MYAFALAALIAFVAPNPGPGCVGCPMIYTFDEAGWQVGGLSGEAAITGDHGYVSAPVALSIAGDGTHVVGGLGFIPMSLVDGATYSVRAWVKDDDAEAPTPLAVFIATLVGGTTEPIQQTVLSVSKGSNPGFRYVELGNFTAGAWSNPYLVIGAFNSLVVSPSEDAPNASGRWTVDDVEIVQIDQTAVVPTTSSKRTAILSALKAAIESVKVANGYRATVGEVVVGPRVVPGAVEAWPHVELQHGEEIKENHAIGRVAAIVSYFVSVYCLADDLGESDYQCAEACAAIEKAVVAFDEATGRFLGLSYVNNVFVPVVNPMEVPPEIERGISLWVMTVDVTYHHEKGNP